MFQLVIYPNFDKDGSVFAEGQVFIDDANSFSFRTVKAFLYDHLTFTGGKQGSYVLSRSPLKIPVQAGELPVYGSFENIKDVNLNGECLLVYVYLLCPS